MAAAVLVFSVIVFCAAILLSFMYARDKKAGLFDPVIQFLFFYALFVLPLPLIALFTNGEQTGISSELQSFIGYMPFALCLCALGLPFFLWAYYSRLTTQCAKWLRVPGTPKTSRYFEPFARFDRTRAAACLICAVSLVLLWKLAQAAGTTGILGFLLLGYNSTAAIIGLGYLTLCFPWLFVGSMLFLYRYAVARKRLDLLIFAALFLFQMGAAVLLGSRNSIMAYVLALVIFWHFALKKLRVRHLLALALGGLVALNLMSLTRVSNYESLDAFVSHAKTAASDIDKSALVSLVAVSDPWETLPQTIRKFGSAEVPCQWGMTYLRAPLFLIPQSLFPKRPLALSNWYMSTFYGEGWGQNQGRQFFFLSEGYLNFGPVGVVVTMLVWGFLLGVLHQYRAVNPGNKGVVLLYALCVAYIFKAISGESIGLLIQLPTHFLGIAVVGLWMAGGFRKVNSTASA